VVATPSKVDILANSRTGIRLRARASHLLLEAKRTPQRCFG